MKSLGKKGRFNLFALDSGQVVAEYRQDIFGLEGDNVVCYSTIGLELKPAVKAEIKRILTDGAHTGTENAPQSGNGVSEGDKGQSQQDSDEEGENPSEEGENPSNDDQPAEKEEKEGEGQQDSPTAAEQQEGNEGGNADDEGKQNDSNADSDEQPDEGDDTEESNEEQQENADQPPTAAQEYSEVLTYLKAGMPVYLYGPAGTGKSTLARNIAKELGIDFYFINCVTQEYKLTGFVNANGHYHDTPFYKALKFGGLFFLDEMDGSKPDALINLNATLADGYFYFPNGEFVEAHPDFRVIAAGNTCGQGADEQYAGRNNLDASTLNRFKKVKIDYQEKIERLICNNDNELIDFCHYIRRESAENGINLIFSYRDIKDIHSMEKNIGIEKIIDSTVFYATSADSLQMLALSAPQDNRFTKALYNLAAKKSA